MVNSYKFLWVLFFALFSFTSARCEVETKISNIEIIVDSADPDYKIDVSSLLSRLKTQKGKNFSQKAFDSDLKKLSEDFDKVSASMEMQQGELQITITLRPCSTIQSLTWNGNSYFSDKKLQKELGLSANNKFTSEKFQKGLTKIKELYLKKGFFESEITYSIIPADNKNKLKIEVYVNEGKTGHIGQIVFQGLSKQEQKEATKTFYSKKYNFITSWITGEGIYKQEAVDQDQIFVLNYLNNLGYADAKVDLQVKENPQSKKLILNFIVSKGKIYHFGKVTISGNKIFKESELFPLLHIKEGETYSPDKIRESIKSIKDFYGSKGYIDSEAISDNQLHPKKALYDVHFEIEENEQFKIGLIQIRGNTQTQTKVILRETLLTPGQVFDSRRLEASQKRLENMGYFKNVNVYAVKSSDPSLDAESYRDVFIEVDEASTGAANLSLGFSSLNDVFGSFELTERNFNYRGLATLFTKGPSSLRGAGEYAHANVTIGKKQRSYLFTWMDPYFCDSIWRFGFELSYTWSKLQTKDYAIKTYGSSIFTSYPITNFWTYGNKYRIRNSRTDLKDTIQGTKQDEDIEDSHGLISAISASIGYDSTDNAQRAHKGIRSFLEAEYVGIWGDFYFLKFGFVNAYYLPLFEKGTFKARGDIKFIEPVFQTNVNKMPLSEKFFLGGDTSVRGYKPYILGPKLQNHDRDPIGGISSLLLSAEYLYQLIPPAAIFFFFDAGCITDKHFSIPKINTSYGVGARLDLMNRVPIILGYGIPINPDHKSDERRFFFSMGGQF